MTVHYTPAQARQILAAAQSAQKQLRDWVEFPEIAPPIAAALDLLEGLIDGQIVIREIPEKGGPMCIGERTDIREPIYPSAGRYRK